MPNYTLYYFNGRGRAEILRMLFAAASVKYMDKRFEFNEWDKYRKDMPCMCVPVLEMDGGMRMPETMAIARYLAREYGFYPKTSMEMMRCDYIADCFYEIMHDYMRYFHWKNGRFRFNMSGSGSGMSGSGMAGSGMSGSGMAGSGMSGSGIAGSGMSGSGMAGSGMSGSGMGGSGMGGSGNGYNSPTNRGGDMNSNYDNYMQWRYMNTCQRVLPFLERTLDMQNGGKNFFMGDQMMWCDMMCYCSLENPYMENQSMFNKYGKLMALRNRVASHPKISGYLKNRSNTNW